MNDGVVTDAETTQRYLHTVLGEVQRLNGLIDDLFELSRLDAGVLTRGMIRSKVGAVRERLRRRGVAA